MDVPPDATVAATCPYCGRPFASTDARDLHVGEVHGAACSAAERADYEAAHEAERDALFYYHLRVVAALGVLYALTVLLYMVALGSDLL
ncbi:DNA-binding protein [Haloplanus aerogenes]|nr:DNA-binding protein [Haloplanus aerogenes]AZH27127.1 DNA-binding protein [Haloplanus aerogenes]